MGTQTLSVRRTGSRLDTDAVTESLRLRLAATIRDQPGEITISDVVIASLYISDVDTDTMLVAFQAKPRLLKARARLGLMELALRLRGVAEHAARDLAVPTLKVRSLAVAGEIDNELGLFHGSEALRRPLIAWLCGQGITSLMADCKLTDERQLHTALAQSFECFPVRRLVVTLRAIHRDWTAVLNSAENSEWLELLAYAQSIARAASRSGPDKTESTT